MNSPRNLALVPTLGLALVVLTSGFFNMTINRPGKHRTNSRGPSNGAQQGLTLEQRVAYQRAIEEVYWRHRIWPEDNPGPKPTLDQVLLESMLREKVENYLRHSNALGQYWQQPLTLSYGRRWITIRSSSPNAWRGHCSLSD